VLATLPENNKLLYDKIKHVGDPRYGIHTVCLIENDFNRDTKSRQYNANVALNVNLKLGGQSHLIGGGGLRMIDTFKTMVVGYHLTQRSSDEESSTPIFVAVVASAPKTLSQWPTDIRLQRVSETQTVNELGSTFRTRLELWKQRNGPIPENLPIYRGSVTELQHQDMLTNEVVQIRSACSNLYCLTQQKPPKITFIAVDKQHHTRFYTKDDKSNDNPTNGTVVDRIITETRSWDFYLQSHSAIKGPARPAHYVVLLNEIFTTEQNKDKPTNLANLIETLTHNMCYMYGCATSAISICAPAYYANIACERMRRHLAAFPQSMSFNPDKRSFRRHD